MAQLSSTLTLDTINSLTHPLISQKISDNITGKIPLLYFMNRIGHKEYENGGIEYRFPILQELATAQAYTGTTTLNSLERDLLTTAVLYRKQFSLDITLSGTNLLKNSGNSPEAVVNYITAQIEIAEEGMKNTLAGDSLGIFSDEADSDLGITGLQTMLTDSTSTGTYASLARSTYTAWQHQTDSVSTNFSTDGLVSMQALLLAVTRGDESPTVIVMTANGYANLIRAFQGTLQYNNPSPKTAFGDVGFQHVNYFGAPVIFDDGVPTNRAYFLNLKYIKLLVHQARDMAIRDFITPHDQDSITGRMYWAGNLVCNNLARQGLLQGTIETYS